MVDVARSECVFHPGKQATHRCKQCGTPTCHKCTVRSPIGNFCSGECRVAHQALLEGGSLGPSRAPSMLSVKIRKALSSLFVLAAVVFAAGVVGSVFTIPILSPITWLVRDYLGI